MKASLRASSREGYRLLLEGYIVPALGHMPLVQLRADHIDAMLAAIRSGKLKPRANRRGRDGKVSARTILHVFAVLRTMMNAAVKRRLIPYSPASASSWRALRTTRPTCGGRRKSRRSWSTRRSTSRGWRSPTGWR